MDDLTTSLSSLFIPKEIRDHFDCVKMEEISNCLYLVCHEKDDADHIPKEIFKVGKVKLDGFTNKIDIQTFPAQGKEVFIRLYRRKWRLKKVPIDKELEFNKSYTNSYQFTEEGIKATKEFGAFLKEIDTGYEFIKID